MRFLITVVIVLSLIGCKENYQRPKEITEVVMEPIFNDSALSVRAIDFNDDYLFYGSSDHIGMRALHNKKKLDFTEFKWTSGKNHFKNILTYNDKPLHFRAIEEVDGNVFAISIANPARLYKLEKMGVGPKLVYEEVNDKVFYDSMNFWNDKEGIAIGDPTEDCMSLIITRDGGDSWTKLSCDILPKAREGEGAFAASDTNIAILGNHTWVATGGKTSRVLYSSDKGETWDVFKTPIIQGKETTGMYSIDFYDEINGFAIGGDYTKPNDSLINKIRTVDGGKTWQIVANGKGPGYRSCVQYIPNGNALELVAVGFKGIDYSKDGGENWKHLTDEGFYTIRFVNDSVAYAGGNGRLAKLLFK